MSSKAYDVVFSKQAEHQLVALFDYISDQGAPLAAEQYTSAIIDFCESLSTFPMRGTDRSDIRRGLRLTNYRGSAIIAYSVDVKAKRVSILGVFYGGQSLETLLDASDS